MELTSLLRPLGLVAGPAAVLAFALLTGTWVEANGTDWAPATSRPFSGR